MRKILVPRTGGWEGSTAGTTSRGVAVTDGGSPGTKGSWIQIFSSTTYDANGFWLMIEPSGATSHRIDIGVGGSGTEQIIIPDLWLGGLGVAEVHHFYVPMAIPRGSRVAVRVDAAYGNSIYVHMTMTEGNLPSFSRATMYGLSGSPLEATAIDPGATANTMGSWIQLTSSTTNNIRCWYVITRSDPSLTASQRTLFNIGVGTGGSEIVVLPKANYRARGYDMRCTTFGPFYVPIPAGTRIAAQCQSDITIATERRTHMCILGFD